MERRELSEGGGDWIEGTGQADFDFIALYIDMQRMPMVRDLLNSTAKIDTGILAEVKTERNVRDCTLARRPDLSHWHEFQAMCVGTAALSMVMHNMDLTFV